jgi:hypothetical protein
VTTTKGITRTLLLLDLTKYFAWLSLSQNRTNFFVDGRIAPPQTGSDMERRKDGGVEHGNGVGVPLLCSCMCGQPSD